jgi:hypothetical protein
LDWRNPEYHIILRIGSESNSDFKFVRTGNPLEGYQSNPFCLRPTAKLAAEGLESTF